MASFQEFENPDGLSILAPERKTKNIVHNKALNWTNKWTNNNYIFTAM